MHHTGQVVNGGLIDFQDNFHRGMADYSPMHANLMNSYQPPCAYQPAMQTMVPPVASYQAVSAAAMGNLPQATFLGHPSFINISGKMYKPVEEPVTAQPANPGSEPVRAEPAALPSRPVITEEDLDRRVEQRLEEWMSTQRVKPSYGNGGMRAAAGGPKGRCASEEERAAARVKSVNAGMRRGYYSPA